MKKKQTGYLGAAYHHYLEYLEYVEYHATHGGNKHPDPRKMRHATLNNRMWQMPPHDSEEFMRSMNEMLRVDAALASVSRSSVKYRVTVDTLVEVADRYERELLHIANTVPLNLPHEYATIIIDGYGADDMVITAQVQKAENGEPYDELGLEPDEEFLCLNLVGYRREGVELENGTVSRENPLSNFPVEIHAQLGRTESETKVLYAGAGSIEPKQAGFQTLDLLWRSFLIWLHQFQLQSVLRHKSVKGARPDFSYRPARLRKRHEHPQFEHTIIQLEVDAPDPAQTGRSIFQPRKRLHQVRGFWRHYRKSGKRVWVKPHWRGDEKLGVLRRDIELVTHEERTDG